MMWIQVAPIPDKTRKIEICTQILELIPEEAKDDKFKAFNDRGSTYANLGEYQKAINDYDQAITLNPNNAISFGNRGVAYANLGEYQMIVIIDGFLVLV
jgi:tetratricopeptide (TPR) repeat protein